MKTLFLCILSLYALNASSQLFDDFSDSNFTDSPHWFGDSANFKVNAQFELQSAAQEASQSYLLTKSRSLLNAVWEAGIRILYPTSSTNYARMYLSVDTLDYTNGFNGYFVQIGGTEDEVSLYMSRKGELTKLIDGVDKSVDGKTSDTKIKVTTDSLMNFKLWRKCLKDSDFVLEGGVMNNEFIQGKYFGLGFSNTKSTGSYYSFDDIKVIGEKFDFQEYENMESGDKWFGFSSEIFYPDMQNGNNTLRILFSLEDENYSSQIKVFNSGGETVRILTQNEQLNSNSYVIWDGKDKDDNLLPAGIYVLYAKLFNLKNGNIKVFKEPIVLQRL